MFKNLLTLFILKRRKEVPFLIFFSFLVTFFIARLIAYSIRFDIVPDYLFFIKTIFIRGYHIHHFNFGIILLAMAGFFSLIDNLRSHIHKIAMIYGVGLALVVDEFGLLITLQKDVYWGRRSYDAVIITALILLNIVYFGWFWKIMGVKLQRFLFRQLGRHKSIGDTSHIAGAHRKNDIK